MTSKTATNQAMEVNATESNDTQSLEQHKQTNQYTIKSRNVQIKEILIEDVIDNDFAKDMKQSKDDQASTFKRDKMIINKTHTIVGIAISTLYIIHSLYWQYVSGAIFSSGVSNFQHVALCLALGCTNLIPVMTVWTDMYSPIFSVSVMLHAIITGAYVITTWVEDVCGFDMYSSICNSASLYQTITFALIIIVLTHQSLMIINHLYQSIVMRSAEKVEIALEKAVDLDIESEDDMDVNSNQMQIEELESGDISTTEMLQEEFEMSTDYDQQDEDYKPSFVVFHQHKPNCKQCRYCTWNNGLSNSIDIPHMQEHQANKFHQLRVEVPKSTGNHAIPCKL